MRRLFYLLPALVLLLAACGGGSNAVAATVNGEEITVGEVEGLIDPGEDANISKEMFAQFLGFDIQWTIVIQAAAEDFGIEFTDEEIEAEAQAIVDDPGNNPEGLSREELLSTNGLTGAFLLELAHQQLLDTAVKEELTPDIEPPTQEAIDQRLRLAELSLAEVCASHILVATEEEAETVLTRLEEGEDFAALAAELSIDTQSGAQGGDLGCNPPGQFVPEFAEAAMSAEIGEVTGPVESQFGFHLILVSERTDPDPDQLPSTEEIVESLDTEAVALATNDWFLGKVEAAEVTVEERYGTWQANPPQVTPPAE